MLWLFGVRVWCWCILSPCAVLFVVVVVVVFVVVVVLVVPFVCFFGCRVLVCGLVFGVGVRWSCYLTLLFFVGVWCWCLMFAFDVGVCCPCSLSLPLRSVLLFGVGCWCKAFGVGCWRFSLVLGVGGGG